MSELPNDGLAELPNTLARLKQTAGNFIAKRFESFLNGVSDGQLALTWPSGITTYHGTRSDISSNNVAVTLHSLQPIRKLATAGDIGFAESYMQGEWSADSLLNLFHLFMRNEATVDVAVAGSWRSRFNRFIQHWQNRNSLRGSQRNIAYHYDLGNDFYRLWLDESMTYSSALFYSDDETLATAQQNKMALVHDFMQASPGQRVLEIGCGWGALAKFMATHAKVDVEGISLSSEQLAYAAEHNTIYPEDKLGSTSYRYEDYRAVEEKYDHIMSVEMIEAVGEKYWETYFKKLNELLHKNGTVVLQAITIEEPRFERYRRQPDFIQRYIFPGGMLPTQEHLAKLAASHGFVIEKTHWFGQSYARTLAIWRQRFEAIYREGIAQGFDDRFLRMWRYYLVYCETGFSFNSTDVGMLKLRKVDG